MSLEIAVCYNALTKAVNPVDRDFFTTISLVAMAGFCAFVNVCLAVMIGSANGTSEANHKKYEREVYSLKTSQRECEIIENNRNLDRHAGRVEKRIEYLSKKLQSLRVEIRDLELHLEYDRSSAYDRSPASDSSTPNNVQGNGKADPERDRLERSL